MDIWEYYHILLTNPLFEISTREYSSARKSTFQSGGNDENFDSSSIDDPSVELRGRRDKR